MSLTTQPRIEPHHQRILEKSAISADDAATWGIRSVTVPEHLERTDLGYLANVAPFPTGILFPLRRPDGSVTYQLRLDRPDEEDDGKGGKRQRKYVQAKDTGAIVNVPAAMVDRSAHPERIAIVEGTKQTIAATLYAPDDLLVVGIQGCANFSHAGLPLDVWRELVPAGDVEVFLCFDADWKSNPNVWDAAKRLQAYLEGTIGVTRPVRLANLADSFGVGGKNGLDDWLGSNPAGERAALLTRLLDKSTPNLGRRPAAKKKTIVKADAKYRVDFDEARIARVVSAPDGFGGTATKEETALAAAARIVESEAHVDEETGEPAAQRLTLEVSVKVEGQDAPVRCKVKVASSRLADVGSWLDRLPHGLGVSIPRSTKPDDDVANAIRTVDTDITTITVIPRTGWKMDAFGLWRWCDGAGAIGPDDKIDWLRGEPASKDFQAINLPGPHDVNESKLIEHVRSFLNARDLFQPEKRFSWDVAIAGWGLAFLGVTPNAAICWFGPPSSGKSTVAEALTSSLNPAWAPRSGTAMSTFNARPAGMDLLPNGLAHCFLHVDDLKPESDPQSMKSALKAFDALLRRAHGSGGAVRGEVDRERDSLGVRKIDNAAPMMFITGEEIPAGGDGFAESGLDRALFIQVEQMSLFGEHKANLVDLQDRARSGRFTYATSSYLSWLATQINATEDPDAVTDAPARVGQADDDEQEAERRRSAHRFDLWRSQVELQRQRLYTGEDGAAEVFGKDDRVSERAKMLAASLMLGWGKVMTWALDVGALTLEEFAARNVEFADALRISVLSHTRDVMGGNVTARDQALAALRNAVSSQTVTMSLSEGATRPSVIPAVPVNVANKPLIGEFRNLPGVGDVVVINHAMAAQVLRYPGGARGLLRALGTLCVLDKDDKPTRTLTVNGTRVQACAIRYSDWEVEEAAPGSTDF